MIHIWMVVEYRLGGSVFDSTFFVLYHMEKCNQDVLIASTSLGLLASVQYIMNRCSARQEVSLRT